MIYAEHPTTIIETALGVNTWNPKILLRNRKFHNYLIVDGVNWWGHISADCVAKYYDDSMNARFPPKGRRIQRPFRQYDCRRCGQKHPFNVYCPFITRPPVVPGECKSCGAVTNVHAEDCQYVKVKDEIGICSFCGQLDHTYVQCPEREEQREIARRERDKNKKNKRKGKPKVRIVSGILTRQRDSDTTSPAETLDPPKVNLPGGPVCSFCGNNTHDYRGWPSVAPIYKAADE